MKRLGKILLYFGIAVALLLIAVISLTIGWRPFIGPKARPLTSRKFDATPQRLERGRYVSGTGLAVKDAITCSTTGIRTAHQ